MNKKVFISESEIRNLFPDRPRECNKGDFGYLALIGGSLEYSGAIRLAAMANAAMRSGAGVASVAAPRSICQVIAGQILEATLISLSDSEGRLVFREDEFAKICARYDCIAFGMGIGNSEETIKAAGYLLKNYDRTLIVDADGLNAMSKLDKSIVRESGARLLLTPHLKEFSRLSGLSLDEIKDDPEVAVCSLANELNAVVLLKGSTTLIAEPSVTRTAKDESADNLQEKEQRLIAVDRGCPGMATAGSGDVLSGILAAICCNAEDLTLAAAAGAYINGAAGESAQSRRSDVTMTASDTAACIAEVIEQIRNHLK